MLTDHVPEADLLLALDGELPSDRVAAIRAHTAVCPSCETRWARFSGLSGEVAALCPAVALQSEERAVASLRARLERVEGRTSWTSRSLVFANTLAAVAAACACIFLLPSLRPVNRVADRAAAYDFEQAVPQGYTSLPFADPALPLDDATVLPVELSAEDLELMGISATEIPAGGGVQAEIILGVDGWPRAIRIDDQQR